MNFAPTLPPGIAFVAVPAGASIKESLLHPEELALLQSTTSEARRIEFARGRVAAHQVLKVLNVGPSPILRIFGTRLPAWPSGVVGSLSHCPLGAVAIGAGENQVEAVGIDVEQERRVRPKLMEKIATTFEKSWVQSGDIISLFSAKECIYKALFPLVRAPLGFRDVEIEPDSSTRLPEWKFRARLLRAYGTKFQLGTSFLIHCLRSPEAKLQSGGSLLSICYILRRK